MTDAKGLTKLASTVCQKSLFGAWSLLFASFTNNQICMAKLASMHRRTNISLPTSKNVFDLNQKHLLADMQNLLDEHEMFEKFGGGETSKQGQAVETISCQANNVSQFRQA